MDWIDALSEDELPKGTRCVAEVAGREILLINVEGKSTPWAAAAPIWGRTCRTAR